MGEYKNQKWTDEYIAFLFELTNVERKEERAILFKQRFPETDFTKYAITSKMCEVGASKKRKYTYNNLPLYAEQIKKGYVRIKVAQPNIWWQKQKWVYLETHPWEYNNINETDVFIFLDGDNRNFDPNNIERLERRLQMCFLHYGGIIKGNATLSRINLARAKLATAMLDVGEKVGLCGRSKTNGRYFKEKMREHSRRYRAKKKELHK